MKKIIAINGSPRSGWNTDILVREAAAGAASAGAEVEIIDLYQLEKYTGCISCFGCKTEAHLGTCICRDGLNDVLEKIRSADGLILGSPVYLGDVTAGLRALYERLVFPYISYKLDPPNYNSRKIPVVFILTSGAPEGCYADLLKRYRENLEAFVGPTQTLVAADTLQVSHYDRYGWTMFDPDKKKERRETVFPQERQAAFALGQAMLNSI
ncbi:MAG: flavodoxin family protein [Clostridiales bacterium]|nr:flavodoxin family protein [Clostridiales bacterium]